MTSWFERLARRYLGIDGLTFSPISRRRILLASALPLFDIVVLGFDLYIDLRFGTYGLFAFSDEASAVWQRIGLVTFTLKNFLTTLAVAVLFLLALGRWGRAEGSWMLLIGSILVVAAILFAIAAVATAALGLDNSLEFRSNTWSGWAARLSLLAFGYFFIALRALGHDRQAGDADCESSLNRQ